MKRILLGFALLLGLGAQAQFVSTPPTLDGNITAAEYGNYPNIGTNGWYVAWDNTYLYLGKTGGNFGEPVIFAADLDPLQPVSGGSNSNGNLANRSHFDHTTTSPFRTDLSVYWVGDYIEYWERDGLGGWLQQIASAGVLDRGPDGTNRECRIRWSDINGSGGARPSAFNWYGYAFNQDPFGSPGFDFFYDVFPNGVNNPVGNQNNGTAPRFFFYQSVPSTASGSASNPMDTLLRSFETRGSYSYTGIGTHPTTLHDMTINTSITGDLDFQIGVNLRGSLVAGSSTSRIRSGSGIQTITFTGTSGTIRNNGFFFGEFSNHSLYLNFSGSTTLAGGDIDCRSFTVASGATLNMSTFNINCNNNSGGGDNGQVYNNGQIITSDPDGLYGSSVTAIRSTFIGLNFGAGSTIVFNGSGQTVDARVYQNLRIAGTGTKTLASGTTSIAASRTLMVLSGSTFNMGGNAITFNAGSNAIINGTVQTSHANGLTAGSFSGLSTGSVSLVSGSTVEYTSASPQTISPLTYHNLTLSGGATDNMGGNVTTNGALTLTSGSLAIGNNTLTINGAFSGNATNALSGNGSSNLTLGSASTGNIFFLSGANAINNYTSGRATTLGNALEIRGLLSQNSGALTTGGFLTIGSGASYQGQINFAAAGSVSGNVTAQRYVSGANNAWRGFSAPVGATYSDISASVNVGIQGQNGANLITLRDMNFWTGAAWEKASNWRIAADTGINATPAGIITAGRGFLAYAGVTDGIVNLTSPATLDLTGALNATTISAPSLVGSNRAYNGWMLMGNPYLATLDWENMFGTADVANLSATIYLYNSTYGSWDSYNATTNTSTGSGTNLIAPFQAFMVKATSATVPTLNFKPAQTSNAASNYNLRQQSIFPIVRLKVTQNNKPLLTAMTLVASQATAGLDADYDSQFPGSFNGVSFYSVTNGDFKLVQNSRPMTTSGISEEYFFEFNGAGNYRIEPNLENVDPFWTIMLEDKITGLIHNLRAGGYTFAHQATNRKDRFVLHINAMTTATNNVAFVKPSLFVNNGTLVVNFDRQQEPTTIEVLDLNGRVMKAAYKVVESVFNMDLNDLANAPYLVRFTSASGIATEKVVLNK